MRDPAFPPNPMDPLMLHSDPVDRSPYARIRLLAWIVASVAMVSIVAQPIGANAQLALGIAAVAAMAVLWAWAKGPLARMAFLAIGSLVILRYIYWRATSTLPSIDDPVSFVFGIVLFSAEIYCVAFLAINLVINADPMRRPPPAPQSDESLPTVDVFVPSYNEDEQILAVTLSAAKSMDYPAHKFTVWLLDDGGTDQKCNDADLAKATAAQQRRASLQALCSELGVRYLTRARNEHAKAGNLNAGLAASQGEIVVVFDADHVPFRPFLRETIGYFADDARLFLVQTPHVFLNPDPIEKNLRTFDRMPSENEMFYSITQRGLDKWNGSFFCGSAALLRRAALTESGGFSGITITEDCETAFELHARGWTSLYVDKPLIAGLQPETFSSFIGQRLRWCQGMFQIMLLKNPALKRGLKPVQRLAYLSSMMFWLFPLPRLIFMFAPLLHIFFDVRIFTSSIDETIAYIGSYVVVNVMIQSYLYGHVRWPWMSELYEYVQGVFLLRAIGSVVMSPRKPTFNVTAKGQSLDHDHLSSLAFPFVVIFAVLAAGVLAAGYRYAFEPGVTGLMLVVGLWAATNLVVAGVALGAVAERKQIDRTPRLVIDRRGVLSYGGTTYDVTIDNVSAAGCSVVASNIASGDSIDGALATGRLTVVPAGRSVLAPLDVSITRVSDGDRTRRWGLSFDLPNAKAYFTIADLMYGDADAITRFIIGRRSRKPFLSATAQFLAWGVTGPLRAISYWRLPAITEATVQNAPIPRPLEVAPETISEPVVVATPMQATIISLAADTAPSLQPQSAGSTSGIDVESWMRGILAMAASECAPSAVRETVPLTPPRRVA